MAFPTLSTPPEYPLDETPENSVIRSEMENGYQSSRQRYTRVRKKWKLNYRNLTAADKTLLDTFIYTTTAGGADSFSWTNPVDSVAHTVVFETPISPISVQLHNGETYLFSWDCTLIEV